MNRPHKPVVPSIGIENTGMGRAGCNLHKIAFLSEQSATPPDLRFCFKGPQPAGNKQKTIHRGIWPNNCKRNDESHERNAMLQWTITFLILALVAGLLGFTGVAGTAASIAQVLFFVFIALLIVAGLTRALSGKNP
jgi:uncharacterized membrane protein YtjA (UPF0391 family)